VSDSRKPKRVAVFLRIFGVKIVAVWPGRDQGKDDYKQGSNLDREDVNVA